MQARKVCLLGDSTVGKSSICTAYVKGEFSEYPDVTMGSAVHKKQVQLSTSDASDVVILSIWDTGKILQFCLHFAAGQERYKSLLPMYYRDAEAILIVYDLTNMDSFDRAKEIIRHLAKEQHAAILLLCANKVDANELRQVSYQEAASFAKERGILFFETSAKKQLHIDDLFQTMALALKMKKPAAAEQQTVLLHERVHLLSGKYKAEEENLGKRKLCCISS